MKAENQIELEKQNLDIVINKTILEINKASTSKTVSELKQSNSIIPFYVGELETKLNIYIHEALLGKAKVKPVPAKALTLLDTMVVAHYTVKTIMNNISSKFSNASTIYGAIAKQFETEYNLNRLEDKDIKIHDSLIKYLKRSGYHGQRLDKITNDLLIKYHSDIVNRNLRHVFIQVAQLAVYLLAECQPVIEGAIAPSILHLSTIKDTSSTSAKSKVMIMPSSWVLDWMRQQTLEGNMLPSYHTAMIEIPKPWTGLRSGGFYTDRLTCNFIKTQVDQDKFKQADLSRTMNAVNRIQETEWEINTDVLNVMLHAFSERESWGDLPSPHEVLAMPYPYPNMDRKLMTPEQLENVKNWATHKATQHDEEHSSISRYLSLNRVLNEAKRFAQYEKIYFAYQVDFRGRIYPIAANLHPQGSAFVKPLLRFHTGKVIDSKDAEQYLAVQGANTYGKDKLRLDEKYNWVIKNEMNIINSALDPIGHDFWKEAEEPWSFLAFCFEWQGYLSDPENFKSKLPIALDGSCNGLQHLSAMLRDEIGGREVNLTANFNKKDIYGSVSELATKMMKEIDSPIAEMIVAFGIERSTCKRPVMIMPYAGTQSSCREYVRDDFDDRDAKNFFGEHYQAAISLTSSTIWSAIGEVVIKGREIMSWFKKSARTSAKYLGTEIKWTTPNGFLVIQRRVKTAPVLYQTSMGVKINVRLNLRLLEETDEPDISGHSSAVSPNFIHSLDACALQETVLLAHEHGIESFAMIHDSYGTHAADTPKLAEYLRRAFVDIYTNNDVLANWISEQPAIVANTFEPLPAKGNLDLEDIMSSEHFFA